jgi:hypothetical protein
VGLAARARPRLRRRPRGVGAVGFVGAERRLFS